MIVSGKMGHLFQGRLLTLLRAQCYSDSRVSAMSPMTGRRSLLE